MSSNEDSMDSGTMNRIQPDGHSPLPPHDLVLPTPVADFPKKLYDMLEDPSIQALVCWGPDKDCFIVKEVNEFSKSVLPRVFNHSNFASFVRQLNKYDFHKIRQAEQGQLERQSCTFYHQYFHGDRPDDLQYIKRKLPPVKPTVGGTPPGLLSSDNADSLLPRSSSTTYHASLSPPQEHITLNVDQIREEHEGFQGRIRKLEENHEAMQSELIHMEETRARSNNSIHTLMNLMRTMTVEPRTANSWAPVPMEISMEGTAGNATPLSLTDRGPEYLPINHDRPPHIPRSHAQEMPSQISTERTELHAVRFAANMNMRRQGQNLDAQSTRAAMGSFGETEVERHSNSREHTPRMRGESDGAVYLHRGDPGESGVPGNLDMEPPPFHAERVGRWSFDTSAVATHGMLHGLGIAVGGAPHISTPETVFVPFDTEDGDPQNPSRYQPRLG